MSEEYHVRVGVLCIQGAFIEHVRMLKGLAESKKGQVTVSVHDIRKPSQLADIDGLIVPGGESTTLSIFLRQNNFEEALKSFVFNEKKPGFVWGTCAGLILLSDELDGQKQGGQITLGGLNIQSTRNIYGRQISSFEGKIKLRDSSLFSNDHTTNSYACDEFHGIFIRAPGVVKLNSPSVHVLATLDDSENSVVAVRQGHLMATCFHPELTTDQRWHSYFLDMILSHKYPLKEAQSD